MEANGGEPDPWEDVFLPVNNNLSNLASWTTDSQMGNEILSSNDDNEVGADDQCVELNDKLPENCVGDNNLVADEGNEIVPHVGMKFGSDEEAFQYYVKYSRKIGFPARRRNARKAPDGSLRSVTFVCSRQGKRTSTARNPLRPHPTMQIGCQARMTAYSDTLGTWRVSVVHLEHNHNISPSKSRIFRCNRQLTDQVKRKLELNDIVGIPLHKSFNSAVVEAGGYDQLTFIEKDCRNYIDQVRRLRLGDGDAAAIQAYFSKMQAQCPGFFFSFDLDEESRLKNVFWADNRCRNAYKEFGDVITFDTTYLTNRYDMPFAPFVGVNHHGQSTLLGCGLISSEDIGTFVWLFKTWLDCMDGNAPAGIITDQDRAMQNAIQIVFPDTKHRWCLWHILKKLPEKFGGHSHKGLILTAVHEAVYDSQIPEEFEYHWNNMLDMYTLHDNDWLCGLYIERVRWVPCFLRTSFWAGMSTTQRSESINAFFDGYVNSKTTLKQFVEQYERALRSKVEKEFQADVKSYTHIVPCVTTYAMEKQIQDVYTLSKFQEFQKEITGKVYCDLVSASNGTTFEVEEDLRINGVERRKSFTILFDIDTSHAICSCHLFEFRGILCRHAISVLMRNGVKLLPESYILRRWRRDVQREYTRVKINYNGWVSTIQQDRYDKLCSTFAKVANTVVDDEIRTQHLIEWLETLLADSPVSSRPRNICGSNLLSHVSVPNASGTGDEDHIQEVTVLDPKCSKRKGAPKKNRQKGPLEKGTRKTKASANGNQRKRKKQQNVEEFHANIQPIGEAGRDLCSQPMTIQFLGDNAIDHLSGANYDLNLMPPYGSDTQ